MDSSITLKLEVLDYWHMGAGQGHGFAADAVLIKDQQGLPCVPGRTVKGLVRDAVRKWGALGHAEGLGLDSEAVEAQLFGEEGGRQGALAFTDAQLPEAVRYHLDQHGALKENLYRNIYSTAIDNDSGVAVSGSLRGQQVAVPATLYGTVSWLPNTLNAGDDSLLASAWIKILESALPLLAGIGVKRHRGFGRVIASVGEVNHVSV